LRLDGNEGSRPPQTMLAGVARLPAVLLRDYPDLGDLTAAIAARHDVAPDQVVVTAGADDAMDRVFRAFGRPEVELLVPVPTFEMIHRFAAASGIEVVSQFWLEDFPLAEMLAALSARTAIVAVVSPNNPTGTTISAADLDALAAAAGRSVLLFDHVYAEYADEDLTARALAHPNVVVLRTLSKAWGLAGCRVGYALAAPELASILRNAANPYPVAALSAHLARERLAHGTDEMARHVAQVRSERERLTAWLGERGIGCSQSEGNFVLVELGRDAARVRRELAALGVLVRAFPHRPEIATAVRVSLPGDERDFRRLLTALAATVRPVETNSREVQAP
jgi:histidinol-phosphate aminotransferase